MSCASCTSQRLDKKQDTFYAHDIEDLEVFCEWPSTAAISLSAALRTLRHGVCPEI